MPPNGQALSLPCFSHQCGIDVEKCSAADSSRRTARRRNSDGCLGRSGPIPYLHDMPSTAATGDRALTRCLQASTVIR